MDWGLDRLRGGYQFGRRLRSRRSEGRTGRVQADRDQPIRVHEEPDAQGDEDQGLHQEAHPAQGDGPRAQYELEHEPVTSDPQSIPRARPDTQRHSSPKALASGFARAVWARPGWVAVVGIAVLGAIGIGVGVARWRSPNATALFEQADREYRAGRLSDAWRSLERLARLRPPSSVDHFLRSAVLLALDRKDEGLQELAAIPDDHPWAALARLTAGQVEIHRFRARPAEAAFLESLRLFPLGVQPRRELVYLYNIQGRQAELDLQLSKLLDQDAIGFQQILHWTKTRNTPWNPEGDLEALEKLAADPEDRWSRLALIRALARTTRREHARSMIETLDAAAPDVRALKIEILLDLGEVDQAEALLDGSVSDHFKLERLRGRLMLKRGDAVGAEGSFRRALAADPHDRATLLGMATALELAGRASEAAPYLAASRRHDALWVLISRASTGAGESLPDLPRRIGLACMSIGRTAEARAWLSLAIKRDPLDSESQRALYEIRVANEAKSTHERPHEVAGCP